MICDKPESLTNVALPVTFWSPYRKGQTWSMGEWCSWRRKDLEEVPASSAAGHLLETVQFCWNFRLSSGIVLPLDLGVLEPKHLNRKSVLGKKDCTRGGMGKGGSVPAI